MDSAGVRRILRTERWLCPHCDQLLSVKTFKAHKRTYYDASRNTWLKKSCAQSTSRLADRSDEDEQAPAPFPTPSLVRILPPDDSDFSVDYSSENESIPAGLSVARVAESEG